MLCNTCGLLIIYPANAVCPQCVAQVHSDRNNYKQQLIEAEKTINDQAIIIERYEAPPETPHRKRLIEETAKDLHGAWALSYTRAHGQLGTRWEDISDDSRERFREEARRLWQEEPWNRSGSPYRKVREG